MAEEKFSITVDSAKNVVKVFVSGTFVPADAQAFVDDYNKKVASIDASNYTLELDCTTMNVVTQEMIPNLEACYTLYKESGFGKVIFQIKDNAVLKMQLARLARNTGLSQAEVIAV